jgi:hypothetical protein
MNLKAQIILDTTLPGLPPGVNSLYATVNGHRVKSAEGKAYSKTIHALLQGERERLSGHFPADGHSVENRLELFLFCFIPAQVFRAKKGKFEKSSALSSSDSDGRLKAGKDSIITALGLDASGKELNDNRVYADHCYKWEARPDLAGTYPNGYTRVIIARFGYAPEILAIFRKEVFSLAS